jgi:hypothetical protein
VIPGQIIINSGFDSNTNSWNARYGTFSHSTDVKLFGSGAARLITADQDARGDYFGLFGQCVNLDSQLEGWPTIEEGYPITIEAHIRPGIDTFAISLSATFHEAADCGGSGPIGSFTKSLAGKNDWTKLIITGEIPDESKSIDVFITAYGSTGTTTVYIDEVRAFPSTEELP